MPNWSRYWRGFAALCVASLLLAAMAAPFALGESGDSPESAIKLDPPQSTSATITTSPAWIYYSVDATRGQTIRVEATAPGTDAALLLGSFRDSYVLLGNYVATSTLALTFTPPRTERYLLVFTSKNLGPFSVTATPTAAPVFTVANMSAASSVRHGRTLSVTARTYPAYNSLACPIRFIIERKSGKKWKSYSSVPGRFAAQFLSGGSSKSLASFKLSKKATYRVRARLIDAAHPHASYSTWKTVKVN